MQYKAKAHTLFKKYGLLSLSAYNLKIEFGRAASLTSLRASHLLTRSRRAIRGFSTSRASACLARTARLRRAPLLSLSLRRIAQLY